MKITYKQFIEAVENCLDGDYYIDKNSKEVKIIEEVIGLNFENITNHELNFYLSGLKQMHDIENESYLYFDDDEED
ncbi:hypothetical protein WKS98_08405 [Lagierella sp. ICN-221743]